MRKKIITMLLLIMTVCIFGFAFSACSDSTNNNIYDIYTVYVAHAESNGETPVSYEEWLESIKGKNGRGIENVLIDENGDLIIEYDDNTTINAGNIIPKNPKLDENNKIIFKSLAVDGMDVFGKVSNSTHYFSFVDEIELLGKVGYVVCMDVEGLNVIPNKIVPLQIGDNSFFIREECGNTIRVYNVIIRRKPIYDVYFRLEGDESVITTQKIEEDSFAVIPVSQRPGYDYSFDWDFNNAVKEDITINVNYEAIFYINNECISSLTAYGTTLSNIIVPTSIDGVSIKKINDGAFSSYPSLKNIRIESGITTIKGGAFYNCENLKSIYLPNSIVDIEYQAFAGCSALEQISFNGTIDEWVSINFTDKYSNPLSYGGNLYINDTLATNISINVAESIKDYAFYGYRNLCSIKISTNVKSIGSSAFALCNKLTSIEIPETVINMGEHVFFWCDSLTIYCEAESKPSDWNSQWNYLERPVVWGYIIGD